MFWNEFQCWCIPSRKQKSNGKVKSANINVNMHYMKLISYEPLGTSQTLGV